MNINLTLFGQTIAMVFFVWFCMRFIWPPILKSLEERQQTIAEGLAAGEKATKNLEEAQARADQIIEEARAQAIEIVDGANKRAATIVAEGKQDGVKERERQLAAARAEIEQEINRAKDDLRGQVSAIAISSAEKILRREIDPNTHQDLLAKLANEI